jgi:hypothetical protein
LFNAILKRDKREQIGARPVFCLPEPSLCRAADVTAGNDPLD